jgi:hypothetical protein
MGFLVEYGLAKDGFSRTSIPGVFLVGVHSQAQ